MLWDSSLLVLRPRLIPTTLLFHRHKRSYNPAADADSASSGTCLPYPRAPGAAGAPSCQESGLMAGRSCFGGLRLVCHSQLIP